METDEGTLVVGNLHATNVPERAMVEVGLAAELVGDAEHVILCGDFNVPRFTISGYSPPIEGIDQILVRGLTIVRGPEPWPNERRQLDGRLLSDHAPVEAEAAWI
jgi:endonuclease/exonuclease/phosphatase family metal-dependent hydrolase